jgi:ABC-type transporter MlaC component
MKWLIVVVCLLNGFVLAKQCENPREFMVNLNQEFSEQAKKIKDADKLMLTVSEKLQGISDAEYVISRVVGRSVYKDMSDAQKKELQSLMAKELVKGFVGALMQVDSGKGLRFYPYRGAVEKVAQVKALYRARSGSVVKLKFILNCEEGRWLIQDVSMDGVMVMDGYISQYKPIVKEKGVDGLIQSLKD